MTVKLWRANSFTYVAASPSFIERIRRHLAIPIDCTEAEQRQTRFGSMFAHGQRSDGQGPQWYGSLVLADGRVPAGLTGHVASLAKHYSEPFEYHDDRKRPDDMYPLFSMKVQRRDYQEVAHQQFLKRGVGIISAPPRSGKTLMAASAMDTLAHKTLYLAPSVAIVAQTYNTMVKHFGEDYVSRLDGEASDLQKDPSKHFVIATPNTAVKLPEEWYQTREMLIVDEFHHAAAETYHKINRKAESIYYRLGLTGTHFRTGTDGLAMDAISSRIIYDIPVEYLIGAGHLADPQVTFMPMYGSGKAATAQHATVYKRCIAEDEKRNDAVVQLADQLYQRGIPTIILTKRRAHADLLGERVVDCRVVKGGEGELTSTAVRDFEKGKFSTLIGTTVIGEGVDLPKAAALIYASAGGAGVQMMQSYFRPLTATPAKKIGYIYDFWDVHHQQLARHAEARFNFAQQHLGAHRVTRLAA